MKFTKLTKINYFDYYSSVGVSSAFASAISSFSAAANADCLINSELKNRKTNETKMISEDEMAIL